MAERAWQAAGLRVLTAGARPQGAGRQSGAQRQQHAGRPQGVGRGGTEPPRGAGRHMDVQGMPGVAQEQRPQVVEGGTQQRPRAAVAAADLRGRPGHRDRRGGAAVHAGDGRLQRHAQFDRAGRPGGQRQFPAQQPGGGQDAFRCRHSGDPGPQSLPRPQQPRVAHAGLQLRPRGTGRDGREFGEVRRQGRLERDAQGPWPGVVDRDALRAAGRSKPFDGEHRVRRRVSGNTGDGGEPRPPRRDEPALNRDRQHPRDAQLAAGQDPAATLVEATEAAPVQLSVFGGDCEGRGRDAHHRVVHRLRSPVLPGRPVGRLRAHATSTSDRSLGRCHHYPRERPCGRAGHAPSTVPGREAVRTTGKRAMAVHRQPGTVLTDHSFNVPLDHADPDGERIEVFAREVVAAGRERDRPALAAVPAGRPGRPVAAARWAGTAG